MSLDEVFDTTDALGMADLVRRGEVKAHELLDTALARVETRNPDVNAVVTVFADEARRAIDDGLPDGPFTGVPFLVKDLNFHVAGIPTTNGSRLLADNVRDYDSHLTSRFRRAGLVLFGKTNTPEFGLNASTEPQLWGPTRNPWNRDRSPGGSSGGAAAAVAAGILPLAHATDGGGSIRIPASACGLFGMKPTRARIPYGPDAGEGWGGMSTSHAVSRTVRDSAALMDATAGYEPGDPYTVAAPARPYLEETRTPPGRLRVAWSLATEYGFEVHRDCKAAVEATLKLLAELGHEVNEDAPSYDIENQGPARVAVIGANTAASIDDALTRRGRPLEDGELEPATLGIADLGRATGSVAYAAAVRVLHRSGRDVAPFFARYDVFVTPTMAAPPARIGALDTMNPGAMATAMAPYLTFTPLWNATGQPAMSVPLYWNTAGLPIGVQFVGRFGDEATLYRLAGQLEEASPWADRHVPR